ncbi:MAG: hypothetical protein NC102_02260 [Clostridium sp.]|nr:hypothetical protein [Clostridium sp.]
MSLKYNEVYENGNPPYELYQGEDGLWGLVDCKGNKLKAVFKRGEKNHFHCVPWEVVSFNPNEGFELDAWYDPCEVWFNFTWKDPRYPAEFGKYLWRRSEKSINEYEQELKVLLPTDMHWIFDSPRETERILDIDDDEEFHDAIRDFLDKNPHLRSVSIADYNAMLDPVMRNESVDEDMKSALWRAKVELDFNIRFFEDEISDNNHA